MRGRRMMVSLLAAVGILAIVGPALAQRGPGPGPGKRREVEEKIRTLRLMKLVGALELDEATAIKVAGILRRTDERRRALHDQGGQQMRALQRELDAGRPRAKELTRLVDTLIAVRRQLHGLEQDEIIELRKVLTPVQQARFVLVMRDFRHEVKNLMRRERRKGRRGKRGLDGPPGPPPDPAGLPGE